MFVPVRVTGNKIGHICGDSKKECWISLEANGKFSINFADIKSRDEVIEYYNVKITK